MQVQSRCPTKKDLYIIGQFGTVAQTTAVSIGSQVMHLRALDMPLLEIADFLSDREIERMEEKLQSQKRAVIEKQEELKRIERKIDNRLRMIADAKNSVFDTVYLNVKKACRAVWSG